MKVLVYGIGDNFFGNYNWIKDNYEIVGLADGSSAKWGMTVGNFIVGSLEEQLDMEYEAILVTPNIFREISKILIEQGISKSRLICMVERLNPDYVGNELRIGFYLRGGMGDLLIAMNYIYAFNKRFYSESVKLEIVCFRCAELLQGLLEEELPYPILEGDEGYLQDRNYDLLIDLKRYPEIKRADRNKISRHMPELIDYILQCEKFRIFHVQYFTSGNIADGSSAMQEAMENRKRIQQPDIYGILGVTEEFALPLKTDSSKLQRYHLRPEHYITVHRGCDKISFGQVSTKLWDVEAYNVLLRMIKERYSDVPIIVIGAEHEKNQGLVCDRDLSGELSLAETKSVLKYSLLHIDCEGGLVHLRHALKGGTSLVLFGPTLDKFFGYTENLNLRTHACPLPCEWAVTNWQSYCLKEDEPYICMKSITPEMVMTHVERFMKGREWLRSKM